MYYIKGNKERSIEIIALLESKGSINIDNCNGKAETAISKIGTR